MPFEQSVLMCLYLLACFVCSVAEQNDYNSISFVFPKLYGRK